MHASVKPWPQSWYGAFSHPVFLASSSWWQFLSLCFSWCWLICKISFWVNLQISCKYSLARVYISLTPHIPLMLAFVLGLSAVIPTRKLALVTLLSKVLYQTPPVFPFCFFLFWIPCYFYPAFSNSSSVLPFKLEDLVMWSVLQFELVRCSLICGRNDTVMLCPSQGLPPQAHHLTMSQYWWHFPWSFA